MIIATLLEPNLAGIRDAIQSCDATADAFEIRLDVLLEPVDAAAVRALTPKPLIATMRRLDDGGRATVSAEERRRILDECLRAGFDHVDIEVDEPAPADPRRAIRSQHDLRATPSAGTLSRMATDLPRESIFKFAGRIRGFADTLQLLAASRTLQSDGRAFALMGLGEFPRALTHLLGARLVYGGGRANAPGQPAHTDIVRTLRHWGDPAPASRLLLVVGDPVEHSLSPRMHNAGLRALKCDAAYAALRVANSTELQMLMERAETLGLLGLSVTTPLKDAAFELCAERTPEAETARAVNCIRFEEGKAIGHNTDGTAAADIARRLVGADARVLLLGTGGAARAMAHQWPADLLTVVGRNADLLRQISKRTGCRTAPLTLATEELANADLVVNATREADPVPLADYGRALFDFHYRSNATAWQEHAARTGAAFAGGRDLLLEQGVRAFRIWTGEDPPTALLRAAIEATP